MTNEIINISNFSFNAALPNQFTIVTIITLVASDVLGTDKSKTSEFHLRPLTNMHIDNESKKDLREHFDTY